MPHTDETFYKMKCGWSQDPKVASLGRFGAVDACLARDLFGQMIDYSRRELTDGLVPVEVIASLAYPLPADQAMQAAMHLADPGPYGPLCSWHPDSNAPGNAGSIADSIAPGTAVSILAYGKWNDSRAEVLARKLQGKKAARARWNGGDAPSMQGASAGDAGGIHRARAQVHTEQEQEQEQEQDPSSSAVTDPAPARAGAREGDDDDLGNLVVALLSKHGPITHDQALGWIGGVLASGGSRVGDPKAYVVGAARGDSRKAYREATTAVERTSSRQPPKPGAMCRRCTRSGHRTEDCPTLEGAAPPGSGDAEHGAAVARKLLAESQQPPDPAPAAEVEHDADLARREQDLSDAVAAEQPDAETDDEEPWF